MRKLGQHRENVTVKTVTSASDGAGGFTFTTTSATVKAQVEPIRGFRNVNGQQVQVNNLFRFTWLKQNSVSPTERSVLTWDGRDFTISSLKEESYYPKYIVIEATAN
jgi:hypothetical protein